MRIVTSSIFWEKPWINPIEEFDFSDDLQTSIFWSKICSFSFLNQNQGKNEKFSIFKTFCFYRLERRFFVLQYRKRHFPGLYCLKKKVRKMAIFGPKPWVNPSEKMSIFRLFESYCFYSLERRFIVIEYWKDIFLAYIA